MFALNTGLLYINIAHASLYKHHLLHHLLLLLLLLLVMHRPNRLLIAHGMTDENVLFTHTSSLLDALVSAGKPYQLQVFTGERHGIRSPTAANHCDASILSFLLKHL